MQIHFCSFADKRFHKTLSRIKTQAREMELFASINCYNESNLDQTFINQFSHYLTPYSFYLCVWKPHILLKQFELINDNDIILYADAGCHLNSNGRKRFSEYINIVQKSVSGILATVLDCSMPEKHWTKGDTFDYFQCRYDENITNTPQIQATAFLVQKRPSTELFLKKWLNVFTSNLILADRNYFISENLPGFIEHRSDQSFFSILSKYEGIELVSAYEVQGSNNWEEEMIDFPIWAKRDKIIDNSFWIHPTPGRLFSIIKKSMQRLIANN